MKVIDVIFNKLIQTPMLGADERKSITQSFNSVTDDLSKFKICKQIEFNYCTDKFLQTVFQS